MAIIRFIKNTSKQQKENVMVFVVLKFYDVANDNFYFINHFGELIFQFQITHNLLISVTKTDINLVQMWSK